MPERIATKAVLRIPPDPDGRLRGLFGWSPASLAQRVLALEARIEALVQALPAKDAEGLARVCMSFAGEMLHKQDDIGQRFWTEQAKRLRGYAALAAEKKP